MILFLSPYQNAPDCAAHIERLTHEQVKIVDSLRLALASLRTHEFIAVVADENLIECTPGSADSLIQRMGAAVPVFVDMACLRVERVAKLVSTACKRRELEYNSAREEAVAELRSEFKSELTGLLISSEIVLKSEGHSKETSEKLMGILEIAKRMKVRLEEGK